MNRSYKITPVYTGDVSGVCSALYELGGMVVIHDPSGCNSTYNTHDEIRWYDQDSLIYISGLNHVDAIMGNDEKFVVDIVRAAKELSPKFIAITSSPIPFINGTDFKALSKLVEKQTGIRTFYVRTNGMHDYSVGAGNALKEITEQLVSGTVLDLDMEEKQDTNDSRINLIGVTPLDFAAEGSLASMKKILHEAGWMDICCFAMGDSLEHLSKAKTAKVSLVVSSVGLQTAKFLEKTYGIPYVLGTPVKGFEQKLMQLVAQAAKNGKSVRAWEDISNEKDKKVTLIGEPVIMESLAAAIRIQRGCGTEVICPLEQPSELLLDGDHLIIGEEEAEHLLVQADIIYADPSYRPISNPKAQFVEIPHLAFSGRCYLKSIKNLMEVACYEQFE